MGDIGRSNIEEVDLVTPGSNYGWTKREGTFVHKQGTIYPPNANPNAGYIYGVSALPSNEATVGVDAYGTRYTYPVAQYDHNGTNTQLGTDYTATSIASGFVINNGSDAALQNQLIFNNFAFNTGNAYHTDFAEMLKAVTQLDPNDPTRDSPSELTQATKYRLHLALDGDSNPNTAPTTSDDLNTLLGVFRNDARYGEGLFGEMYISTKDATKRSIYLVTNSVPLLGDYNKDHVVNAADYTVWRDSLGQTGYQLAADGNGDGVVDSLDYAVWQSNFGKVWSATAAGSAAAVPEPATGTCALIAAAILFARSLVRRRASICIALWLTTVQLFARSAVQHPDWPGKGQLFVGTCYQPVDRSPEQIRQDIALMKQAGFTLVRMGDLSWDAFEPAEDHFEFAWFDEILEQMQPGGNQGHSRHRRVAGADLAASQVSHGKLRRPARGNHPSGRTVHGGYQRSGLS